MENETFSPCPYCDGRKNNCADCELMAYRSLKAAGRLVVLPFKPGATAYDVYLEDLTGVMVVASNRKFGAFCASLLVDGEVEEYIPLEALGENTFWDEAAAIKAAEGR